MAKIVRLTVEIPADDDAPAKAVRNQVRDLLRRQNGMTFPRGETQDGQQTLDDGTPAQAYMSAADVKIAVTREAGRRREKANG